MQDVPPTCDSASAPYNKLLIAALAVSLSINLLIAGMVAGDRLQRHPGGGQGPDRFHEGGPQGGPSRDGMPPHPSPFDVFVKSAPEPVQPILKDAIAAYQPTALMAVNEIREARRAAVEQLKRQPFDPKAASAAFARLREVAAAAQANLQEAGIAAYAKAYGLDYDRRPAVPTLPTPAPHP